jgi:16S rRNA (adenine1518-N6/adenine1519-N6)-dimethyltransferase
LVFAKKSYGQHFLHQKAILQKIAELILKYDYPNLLEIGPGKGALTEYLLIGERNFKAIELEHDMQDHLLHHNILTDDQLIRADVLKVDFSSCFQGEPFLLCGNFPYNISSQILIKTLQNANLIPVMIGMFQKEVVMRIISAPGSKEYGTLSVMTQLMYNCRKSFDINPSAFNPPPKVMSSVLELNRKSDCLSIEHFTRIQKLVRTSFQYRRKTLRNNLKSFVEDQQFLSDSFFDRRPEDLSPQEYLELLERIELSRRSEL